MNSNRSYAEVLSSSSDQLAAYFSHNKGQNADNICRSDFVFEKEENHFLHGVQGTPLSSDTDPSCPNIRDEELNWIFLGDEKSQKNKNFSTRPAELFITGFNQHLDQKSIKNLLTEAFENCVEILNVYVSLKSNGNATARVRVGSEHDAQYAISQLQGCHIGGRRIHISLVKNESVQWESVRSNVAQLLSEIPKNKMPVFLFREQYEARYLTTISVSELNRMPDICYIVDEEFKRMICARHYTGGSSSTYSGVSNKTEVSPELPYCPEHSRISEEFILQINSGKSVLPIVKIGLKSLAMKVQILLQEHNGKVPLHGFPDCYRVFFGPLESNPEGVPLEHLISCIAGVKIYQSQNMVKYITWNVSASSASDTHSRSVNPMLFPSVAEFSKEIVQLLKTTTNCLLPFSQFIPEYHRRYSKQCRVSDYGFTKLLDLLESLPHIVQVLGTGQGKMITLSHTVQTRRFTYELMKILKNQPNKQLLLSTFPQVYFLTLNRVWNPVNYGVCYLQDLIEAAPKVLSLVRNELGEMVLCVPRREQTHEEMEHIKRFSAEIIELLKHKSSYSINFDQFIPSYHQYFGRQCRLSKYGFEKLIELFEAIPEVVTVTNRSSEEKIVQLTIEERLKILGERLTDLLNKSAEKKLTVAQVQEEYRKTYNTSPCPSLYDVGTFEELVEKVRTYVKLSKTDNEEPCLCLFDNTEDTRLLLLKVRRCFIVYRHRQLSEEQFLKCYFKTFSETSLNVAELAESLQDVIEVTRSHTGESMVSLTKLQYLAHELYQVVENNNGTCPISLLKILYKKKFEKELVPEEHGYTSVVELVKDLPETLVLVTERIVGLNPLLIDAGFSSQTKTPDNFRRKKFYDLWSTRVFFSSPQELFRTINGPAPAKESTSTKPSDNITNVNLSQIENLDGQEKGLIR